jgi:ATP-dependent protease ClpP protease subunit
MKRRGLMTKTKGLKSGAYAMERQGESAEITMYGEIVRERPLNWWGEPEQGDFIIQGDFLRDLQELAGVKKITLRMHSIGGDVLVGLLIHNRLRELARAGVQLCCVIDGAAMSAASVIMCACDDVLINPCSLVMVHKCWGRLWGGFNADELRELADEYDAHDKAMIAAYQRKCGLSADELTSMMSDTTYMTGEEALEKGFADKLLEGAKPLQIAASANRKRLFVNGRAFCAQVPAAFNIPVIEPEAKKQIERGQKKMAGNLKELREEYPELVAELEQTVLAQAGQEKSAAAEAERCRLQEIDKVAALFDAELVRAAKYGEQACTAQELAYRAAQAAAEKRQSFLRDWQGDIMQSGAAQVGALPNNEPTMAENLSPEQRMAQARAEVKALLGKEKQ